MIPLIEVYGQFKGHWSNANVTRGLCSVLVEHFVLKRIDVDEHERPPTPVPGAKAALFVGYPVKSVSWLFRPELDGVYKIGAFITESSSLPAEWVLPLVKCDLVITPSAWCANTFKREALRQFNRKPEIMIVHHGIDSAYMTWPLRTSAMPHNSSLNFLHIAGARDFLIRKGTPQLIEAFARVFSRKLGGSIMGGGKLYLRVPATPLIHKWIDATGVEADLFEIDYHDEAMSSHNMVAYLQLSRWAALVQPSRAEAFGIIPVEARACGLPVVLSACAGHREHLSNLDTIVSAGEDEPITVNGIPNGTAPTVTSESIVSALEEFTHDAVHRMRVARGTCGKPYAMDWQWSTVTETFVHKLKEVLL